MAKKTDRRGTAKRAANRATDRAQEGGGPRTLTETIVDFGRPMLARLERSSSPETVRDMFQIIIVVWNAHVRATPAWGDPESLHTLRALADDASQPELARTAFELLTARRAEHFAGDVRAVDHWEASYDPASGELTFVCKALLPPGAAAMNLA
jgi:hypothetical protein